MFLHKLVHCVAAHHRQLERRDGGVGCRFLGLSMMSVGPFEETCQRLASVDSALSRRISRRLELARRTAARPVRRTW